MEREIAGQLGLLTWEAALPMRHTTGLITGRVGYVRATSANPAAENMATVPV
jgi:hypothetical protein